MNGMIHTITRQSVILNLEGRKKREEHFRLVHKKKPRKHKYFLTMMGVRADDEEERVLGGKER